MICGTCKSDLLGRNEGKIVAEDARARRRREPGVTDMQKEFSGCAGRPAKVLGCTGVAVGPDLLS